MACSLCRLDCRAVSVPVLPRIHEIYCSRRFLWLALGASFFFDYAGGRDAGRTAYTYTRDLLFKAGGRGLFSGEKDSWKGGSGRRRIELKCRFEGPKATSCARAQY